MPAESGKVIYDYISSFEQGMNSGSQPILLDKRQLAFAFNATVRGGLIQNRPPFTKQFTYAWESPLVQAAVEGGLFQGACYYKPDSGVESIVAQISGRLYDFRINGDVISVYDVSIDGDPNDSTTTQAWLWQAEKWVIVNNGKQLPIFYDGATSRRSTGESDNVATIDGSGANWITPAIGDSVTVTLTDAYTGPVNVPVLIRGVYYQPVASGLGYKVKLTTVYDTSSSSHPTGSQVIVQPSVAGYITVVAGASYNTTSIPASSITATLTLSTPFAGAVGALLSITGEETNGTYEFVNGTTIIWRVTAISGNQITVTNNASLYSGPRAIVGYRYLVGTVVQISGSSEPNVLLGTTSAEVPIGPAGTEVELYLSKIYSGESGQIVFINGGQYSIESIAEEVTGTSLTIINLSDDEGVTVNVDTDILTVPELPIGRMGAYVMGQNWMSLADGTKFVVSDLSRGPSGTQGNDYRDAVLKLVDLTFGGGAFAVPQAGSYITSIIQVPKLDQSLGQGAVQIGTSQGVFSATAPFDFYNPPTAGPYTPILPQILIGQGPISQNGTILVNSDTVFRTSNGIASLIQARRDFTSWGNTSISEEVGDRVLSKDNEYLLPYGSGMVFDNRAFETVSPQASSSGVIHAGAVVINLDPVSSLRGKSESVYDGLWTGVNVLQYVTGSFSNRNRAFAFSYNVTTKKIELYEMLPTSADNRFDNGYIPITWGFETASLFNRDIKEPQQPILLEDGEIALNNVLGRVRVQVWYKFDEGCWIPWTDFSICADTDGSPQNYPRLGLGKPSSDGCNDVSGTSQRRGYAVQIRFQITGSCRFISGRFKATTAPSQEFPSPICNAGCTPV